MEELTIAADASRTDTINNVNRTNEKVVVRGLDEHGYLQVNLLLFCLFNIFNLLQVRSSTTGRLFSLHPDGNTFDMMKNLIRAK
jgi:hypothetical protein